MNLHIQKNGKSSKGFYIALGVCLIAIGVAAWTTYDSVVNYSTPQDHSQSETARTNNTVSGIYVTESSASSAVSSAPASSAPSSAAAKKASSKPAAKKASAKALTFTYPVGRTILQKFSQNPVYCKTTQDWRSHMGLDLSAKEGEAVRSCAEGTVISAGEQTPCGNAVIIRHGEYEVWYCGLDKIDVKKGDTVTQGHEIGTIGGTQTEKGEEPHLHLVFQKNGQYIDPLTVLD